MPSNHEVVAKYPGIMPYTLYAGHIHAEYPVIYVEYTLCAKDPVINACRLRVTLVAE